MSGPMSRPSLDEAPGAWVRQQLRYCGACLSRGWHSTLFQHLAFHTCPLHAEPLRTCCGRCHSPLRIDVAGLARSPFCCDRCGAVLTAMIDAAPGPPRACFESLHAALRRVGEVRWSNAHVIESARSLPMPAVVANVVRRFVCWPSAAAVATKGRIIRETFAGPLEDSFAVDTDARVEIFLASFRQLLCDQEIDTCVDAIHCSNTAVLAYDHPPLAAGTAALALVSRFYAGHPLSRHRRWPSRAYEVARECEVTVCPVTSVIESELWGLTARLLLRMVRRGGRGGHAWRGDAPEEHEYVVPVRVVAVGGKFEIAYRPRVNAALVSRLLRRYGHRILNGPDPSPRREGESCFRPALEAAL